jgi:hypothetical protein
MGRQTDADPAGPSRREFSKNETSPNGYYCDFAGLCRAKPPLGCRLFLAKLGLFGVLEENLGPDFG